MAGKRVGRPSAYREEYAEQARKLCLLGHTVEELAMFFGVATSTITLWMSTHKEFSAAIKAGRVIADAQVASSLYMKAVGYDRIEQDVRVAGGGIVITDVERHYPPDTMSAIYWLNNRQRGRWSRNPNPAGGDDDIPPTMISFEVEDGRTRPDSTTET